MKYIALLAVTVNAMDAWRTDSVPEMYKANLIDLGDEFAFSAAAEATDNKISFSVTMRRNRWMAIGFGAPDGAVGDEQMKGDYALLRAEDNDNNIMVRDYFGKNGEKPDGEDGNQLEAGADYGKDGDTRTVTFMRALDTGEADNDVVFTINSTRG